MWHPRRLRHCLAAALCAALGALAPGLALGADAGAPAGRLAREAEVLDRLARGEDVRTQLGELAQEAAGRPREPLPPASREAADLRQALASLGGRLAPAERRAAGAPSREELAALLAAWDEARAADLLVRERFRTVERRIGRAGLGAAVEERLKEAEASYTRSIEALLGPLAGPMEALRRTLRDDRDDRPVPAGVAAEVERAASGLRSVLAAAAEPAPAPILRASLLPYRRAELAARPPVTTPAIVPTYLDPAGIAPAPADRAPGPETPFAPEILAKAAELGHDAPRIFEHVRNTIRTEWYAGGMKGALGTLRQGSGNDVDQASLLIALLRASGASARYVHGVIELPIETLAESLGVPATGVPTALARAGVAHTPVVRGGRVAAVRLEHTWVSVWIPYTNYRGTVVDLSGASWVPLAPALKRLDVTPSTGVLRRMGYSVDGLIASQLAAPQPEAPLPTLRRAVETWLAREEPGQTYAGQLGASAIRGETLGLLPSSLPTTVVAVTAESAALAPAWSHRVRIVVRTGNAETDPASLDLELPLARVAGERLTLSWIPATVDDQQTVEAFGGLELVPAYLVRLRPQLRLAGSVLAVGEEPVGAAALHRAEVTLAGPAGEERVTQTVVAGSYQALALSGQKALRAPAAPDDVLDPADDEYLAARLLAQTALGFAARWDEAESELAGLLNVSIVRPLPALAVAANAVTVERLFDLPYTLRWDGVTLDAALRVAEPLPRGNDPAAARDWMRLSALHGSALEHLVFEDDFLVEAISADKGIALARQAGVEIVRLDAANVDALLPTLQHPAAVKDDLRNQARLGFTVEIPRTPITRAAWTGSVWRVEDPASGAAGYFISGGLAGGATVVPPDEWILRFLADALRSPGSIEANPDPNAGVEILKIPFSDGQTGEVGERLPIALAVLVRDEIGRPVQGAPVTFLAGEGGGMFLDDEGREQTSLTVPTGRLGVAFAPFQLGETTEDNPVYVKRSPGDTWDTQALMHLVEAAAPSSFGPLLLDAPFELIGYPGAPLGLVRLDTVTTAIVGTPAAWSDTLRVHALDRFANPVSNVPVTFTVGAAELADPSCRNATAAPRNAELFDPTTDELGHLVSCPNPYPTLGECGQPSLARPTSFRGAAAGVILGDSAVHRYRVGVASPGLPPLSFTYGSEFQQTPGGDCDLTSEFRFETPTASDEQGRNIMAGRAGSLLGQPVRFALSYWRPDFRVETEGSRFVKRRLTSGRWLRTTGKMELQVSNGGVATAAFPIPQSSFYLSNVSTGITPGLNEVTVRATDVQLVVDEVDATTGVVTESTITYPFPVDGRLLTAWGLRPRITSVTPSPIPLASGRSTQTVVVAYDVEPAAYASARTEMDFFRAGPSGNESIGTATGTTRSAAGQATVQRGFPFDVESTYEAELVLNRGTAWEIRSDRAPLPLRERIFNSFQSAVYVSQDADLLNQRYCPTASRFQFSTSQRARVTLAMIPVSTLDPSQSTGGEIVLFRDLELDRGEHSFLITPAGVAPADYELPPGVYRYELRGVSLIDFSEDLAGGTAVSELRTHDSLPVGHTLVQGVDLFDGHLSLSREDFRIPGRRLPLGFERTYASNAGGEPGPLGSAWTHNWESQIVLTPCGEAIVRGGEGSGMRFVSDGNGGLRPLKGYHGTLIRNLDNTFDFYAKSGTRYHYLHGPNDAFQLEWVRDPDGNTTTLEYEFGPAQQPLLKAVRDAAGRTLSFSYETRHFAFWSGPVLVQVEGPDGIEVSFDYDAHANLTRAAREQDSRVETYAYALPPDYGLEYRHKLLSATNALNGATTTYEHSLGAIGVQGEVQHPSVFVRTVREPEGGETLFSFDESGLVTRSSGTLQTAVTDPRGKVTTYTLNQYGSPLAIEDPLHHTTTMEWSPDDAVMTRRTDANGVTTLYTYDEHGNPLTETVTVNDVDGVPHTYTVETTYWPPETFDPPYIKDRIRTQKDRKGTVTSYTYDARGRLTDESVTVQDLEGTNRTYTVHHTYLPNGDRSSTTDRRGFTTSFAYDTYGNPAKVTDARLGETATSWNLRSLPVSQTDAEGRTTTLAYDTLGRLIRKTLPRASGETGDPIETFVYDDVNNRVTQTDAEGRVTRTTTDRQGRVVEIVNPAGGTKDFTWDGAGNKIEESNWFDADTPRTGIAYAYDDAGRLARRTEPLGRITEYVHDPVGNLLSETVREEGNTEFAPRVLTSGYDGLNRKIREERPWEGGTATTLVKYDGEGNKVWQSDPLGRITTFRYDALDRLLEKTEPDWKPGTPRVTRFVYDGNGNLIEETLRNEPSDQVRRVEYDELSRPIRRIDAEGKVTQLEYDRMGNLTRQIDPRLNVTTHEYDARDRRVRTTVALNRITQPQRDVVTRFGYDRVGNRVREIWPNGNEVVHTYDGLNRLRSSQDSLGALVTFDYDANGNRLREVDANGHETLNRYDALFRLVEQRLPENRTVSATWDAAGNKLSETDARGFTTTFAYDRLNRLVKTTDPQPFGFEATATYDAVGNKLTETNRRGHTTTFEYDALNRLVRTTAPAPLGYTMALTYDAADNQRTATDRRGIVTESFYDRENRLTRVQRAGLTIRTIEYDGMGNKIFETDANRNVTGWEYDERNLVLAENRPLAAITRFRLDDQGDRVEMRDPEGRITTYVYDARRRLTSETNHAQETTAYAYDGKGNRTRLTRPEGNFWIYRYDDADRLEQVESSLAELTVYEHDANGNRTAEVDAESHRTTFEYDELDRRTARIAADGTSRETYAYNENGNQIELVDPRGQRITYQYDELDREVLRSYGAPASPTGDDPVSIATAYDPNNNPLTITETYTGATGTAVTRKTYDAFDRLETVTDRFGEKLVYAYDANGNRTSLQDPDNRITTYAYDGLNRLASVTVPGAGVTTYDYFRDSRLKKVSYPNGATETTAYDAAARVQSLDNRQTAGAATPLSRFEYLYDKNGNRTRQTEIRGAITEATDYAYDDADRLLEAAYPDKRIAYTYDKTGNRKTEKTFSLAGDLLADKTFTYDARNRLTAAADLVDATRNLTFEYDANGNQTARVQAGERTEYTYNIRDQLVTVRRGAATLGLFGYDYQGLRVTKLADGQLLRYVYDDQSVLLQTDPSGTTVAKYDYGPDRLLSLTHATQGRQFYLFDALGSVTDLIAQDGSLRATYQYDAWGNSRGTTGGSFNIFGFTGHERDDETGLYYFKARFYDPELGIFLSEDPAAGDANNPPSLHRYLYAYGNPTVYVDPDGRIAILTSFRKRIRHGIETIHGLADAYDQTAFSKTLAGRWLGSQIGGATGILAGGAEIGDMVVGGVNMAANTMVLTAADSDGALAQEAALELDESIQTFKDTVKTIWEHPVEVGTQLVTAAGETLLGTYKGEAGATSRLTSFVVQAVASEGGGALKTAVQAGARSTVKVALRMATRQADDAARTALRAAGRLDDAVDHLNTLNRVRKATTTVTEAPRPKAPDLIPEGQLAPGVGCFIAGTLVATRSGPKPIEEVQVGELVWARSDSTGEIALHPVTRLFRPSKEIIEVETETADGRTEVIGTTEEHPFWVEGEGWVEAGDLEPGARLFSITGQEITVRRVEATGRSETVYNFEVEEVHTYFVGAAGAWVHNQCSAGGPQIKSPFDFEGNQPQRLALPPATPTTLSLRDVRNLRGEARWQAAEVHMQELYGSPGQKHFAVDADPSSGITGEGGRFVDAPVDLPNGGTLGLEIKMYQQWRTVGGVPQQQTVPLTDAIRQQVMKDVWLRDQGSGFDPRWLFLDAAPSPELSDLLTKHGVTFIHYK